MSDATRISPVLLHGRDHPRLGEVALEAAGEDTVLALTRGWRDKAYAYVDPNEDCAGAAVDGDRRLLVVADGHHGTLAAEAAVAVIFEQLAGVSPSRLAARDLVAVFFAANQAIRRVTQEAVSGHRGSRTTLTVALAGGGRLCWAMIGDSPVFVVGPREVRELGVARMQFLGDAASIPELAGRMSFGSEPLDPRSWLVLATDGFSNFAAPRGRPADAVDEALAGREGVADAAHRLLDAARRGGAGDNVALVVNGPSDDGRRGA
jgi:serine/threonine protein phosphatase PrpC